MALFLHLRVLIAVTFLANEFKVNTGEIGSTVRTCYFGPPPKPVPGEHWMQTAVRAIRRQCPAKQINNKEISTCSKEEPLDMEDGRIPNASITASSVWTDNIPVCGPHKARLNIQGNTDRSSHVTTRFRTILHTRFIRILPTNMWTHYSMRFEVVGCYEE